MTAPPPATEPAPLSADAKVVRSYFGDEWRDRQETLRRAVAYYSSLTVERTEAAYRELLTAGRVEEHQPGPLLAPPVARLTQTEARVAARAAAKAWNGEHQRRAVVVTVVGEDPEDEESVDVVCGPACVNADDVATIMSLSNRPNWPLAGLTVHALNTGLACAAAPEPEPLDFPPPDCTRCGVTLDHDGDGWTCRYCKASWSSHGSDGTYPCVECQYTDASVTGDDGQPRCTLCEARVRAGLILKTPPYECGKCETTVYGVGLEADSEARRNRLCPGCQHAEDHAAYINSILRRIPVTATEVTG